MDLPKLSETAFGSPLLVHVAAEASASEEPFTVTEMTSRLRRPRSSVERAVKRLAAAGLLTRVGTFYHRAPEVPQSFWAGFADLRRSADSAGPAPGSPARHSGSGQ